jgi:hypothetical protein
VLKAPTLHIGHYAITALAYAVTEEQAWMIERRRKDVQDAPLFLQE